MGRILLAVALDIAGLWNILLRQRFLSAFPSISISICADLGG